MMVKHKIVNKTKEAVTLKVGDKLACMSWELFAKNFTVDPVNKNLCTIRPEYKKKIDEANDLINNILVRTSIRLEALEPSQQLNNAALVGSSMTKVCELLECSQAEAIAIIQERKRQMFAPEYKGAMKFTKKEKEVKVKPVEKPEETDRVTIGDAAGFYDNQKGEL